VASYNDLRQETGLALSTISKYFNGRTVLEENRVAIEAAVAKLDYQPNLIARSLRLQRTKTVGVLLPALNSEFHLSIIAGAEAAFRDAGISLIVAASPSEAHGAVELLRQQMVDGIIAVASPHDIPGLTSAAERIPIVLIDHRVEGLAGGVFLDNEAAGRLGTRHLLDHGHSRIALLTGPESIPTMRERVAGAVSLFSERNAEIVPEIVRTPISVDDSRQATSELLMSNRRPTAIFAMNDELTMGAVTAIHEHGLRIARDIAVIGFDGVRFAAAMKPRLTVVTQDTHRIAAMAVQQMLDRLGDSEETATRVDVLAPQLVSGESVNRIDEE